MEEVLGVLCIFGVFSVTVSSVVLAAWVCAVAVFLNKWSRLRIAPSVNSYEGRSKPKNIWNRIHDQLFFLTALW